MNKSRNSIVYHLKKYGISSKKKSKYEFYDWKSIQNEYDLCGGIVRILKNKNISRNAYDYARDNGLLKLRTLSESNKFPKKSDNIEYKRQWTAERRMKQSIHCSLNNPAKFCKWYQVGKYKVQGTWETFIAESLDKFSIKWKKLSGKKDLIFYKKEGVLKSYLCDFFLSDFNLYVEVKGYWWRDDKEKMRLVMEQNKNLKFIIIEKDLFRKIKKDLNVLYHEINSIVE